MVVEGEFIAETIFGGFVSKVVNNVWDVSWIEIKKADNSRVNKNQRLQTRIYQIIIDVFNLMTHNQYKEKDIIYETAERLLKEFKSNSNYNDAIKYGMKNLLLNIDDSVCKDFISLLCHELAKEKNFDLYKEILLLLINEKSNYTNEELQQIQHKLDYVVQKLNEKSIDTQDIKIEEDYQIQSRTQKYAEKWNANMFLNDFSEWDENRGVNVKLKDVYINEHLPHFIWGSNRNESNDLKKFLSNYFDGNNQMLLILGQPGIGKSTLITWMIANFKDLTNKILVYQFASDLRCIEWDNTSKDYDIWDEILKLLNLTISKLKNKVLIIDGLDEIDIKNGRINLLNYLHRKYIELSSWYSFSFIITCRENYINNLNKIECRYITLQPWSEMQIKSFCNVYGHATKNVLSEKMIGKIRNNREVLGIPLILYMVLALGIKIEENDSIVDVYDQIFSLKSGGIYDRCIDNRMYENLHRISRVKVQIHQISREIALWMFENNPDEASIPQKEYESICNLIMQESKKRNKNVIQDFKIGNYFNSIKHCEGIDTEKLCFVHRSIYEYFVAEFICESINKAKSVKKVACVLGNVLKGNILSSQILKFLKHKILNRELNGYDEWFEKVNNSFQIMLQDGMTYFTEKKCKDIINSEKNVFANVLEIIQFWNKKYLSFDTSLKNYLFYNRNTMLNLQYAELERIDLEESDLRNINFSNAKLSGANLKKAVISKSILNNAVLYDVKLNKANLDGADLRNANLIIADLSEASMVDANLSGAKFNGTYMIGADLRNAIFTNAELLDSDLSDANLRDANLVNANLSNSYLCRADLTGANLRDIILENVNYKEALFDNAQADYLEKRYNLKDVRVLISDTKEVVWYDKYCKKKQGKLIK